MSYVTVETLKNAVLDGKTGPDPGAFTISGASHIYQTTRLPGETDIYENHYLLIRVEAHFGVCCHVPEQMDQKTAGKLPGEPLSKAVSDSCLPVQIAALDAYLGNVFPHRDFCQKEVTLPYGTTMERARRRDALVAETARIRPGQKVALIGVVNPLVSAIRCRGGVCLPCDFNMEKTLWGDVVEKDMEQVLEKADSVICTAMTLGNGTFDRILECVRQRKIPLTVYAQTGSSIVARFLGNGVTGLVAETFPLSQFSPYPTTVYQYLQEEGDYDERC